MGDWRNILHGVRGAVAAEAAVLAACRAFVELIHRKHAPCDGGRSADLPALAACAVQSGRMQNCGTWRFSKYRSRDCDTSATVMPLPNDAADADCLMLDDDAAAEPCAV